MQSSKSTVSGRSHPSLFINVVDTELSREQDAAVNQYLHLKALPDPHTATLAQFTEWLSRPTAGAIYLEGRDRDCWDRSSDLMALGRSPRKHRLAQFTFEFLLPLWHKFRTSDAVSELTIGCKIYLQGG